MSIKRNEYMKERQRQKRLPKKLKKAIKVLQDNGFTIKPAEKVVKALQHKDK